MPPARRCDEKGALRIIKEISQPDFALAKKDAREAQQNLPGFSREKNAKKIVDTSRFARVILAHPKDSSYGETKKGH